MSIAILHSLEQFVKFQIFLLNLLALAFKALKPNFHQYSLAMPRVFAQNELIRHSHESVLIQYREAYEMPRYQIGQCIQGYTNVISSKKLQGRGRRPRSSEIQQLKRFNKKCENGSENETKFSQWEDKNFKNWFLSEDFFSEFII